MAKRRRRDDDDEDEDKSLGKKDGQKLPSLIKNKQKRSEVCAKLKHEKKEAKRKRIKARDMRDKECMELGEAPPPRKTPRTIENTREPDETVARPDDDELHADDAVDEFGTYFNREHMPKILITTSDRRSSKMKKFILELLRVFPNAHYHKRGTYTIKQIVKYAKNRDFSCMFVIHENRKEPNGLLLISLPDGPTAHFRLSSLVLSKDLKNHGKPTNHLPELILNNFTTRLGHRIGRMLASMFPQDPNFRGRRAVTFHNQRDFIFFRHHRYIFDLKEVKDSSDGNKKKGVIARLQECGPRFTLKLLSLQHGTFDSKYGEYEWVHKSDMDTSRRRFFL